MGRGTEGGVGWDLECCISVLERDVEVRIIFRVTKV